VPKILQRLRVPRQSLRKFHRSLRRAVDDDEGHLRAAEYRRATARHGRDPDERHAILLTLQVLQHALRGQIAERGSPLATGQALHAPRHAQRLPHQAIEQGAAGVRGTRIFPGAA
jgi:hypothetical protein